MIWTYHQLLTWINSGQSDQTIVDTITELRIINQRLSELPPQIARLRNLRTLMCRGNNFVGFPLVLTELTNLREFYYMHNGTISIPPEISNLVNLSVLALNANELTTLPEEIYDLQLETFSITTNHISILPAFISRFRRLRYFACDDNQLTALPEQIGDISGLSSLSCSDNFLRTIPSSIGQLTLLEVFKCNFNRLVSLPEEIINCQNLITIEIAGNPQLRLSDAVRQFIEDVQYDTENETDYEPEDTIDDNPNVFNRTQQSVLQTVRTNIPTTSTVFDPIAHGDVNITEYLREDPRNIVFKYANSFYASNKNDIINHIISDNSNIKFACISVGTSIIPRRENVILDVPYLNLNSLGIPIGLIRLADIKTIVFDNRHQLFEISNNIVERLITTASYQMIYSRNPDAVSASHCQEGQGGNVYTVSIIEQTGGSMRSKSKSKSKSKRHKQKRKTKRRR